MYTEPISHNLFIAEQLIPSLYRDLLVACQFESKWKSFSRKLPRKKNGTVNQVDDASVLLLLHRQAALNRVKRSLVCDHLQINWHLNPS